MPLTSVELRQRKATLVTEARGLLDRANPQTGEMSAEDRQQYDRILGEARTLTETIERVEGQEAEERALAQALPTEAARRDQPGAPEGRAGNGRGVIELRGGRLAPITVEASAPEARRAMELWLRTGQVPAPETRALQADSDTVGGYLRPDQEFTARLIQAVDDLVFMRQLGTVISLAAADSIGFPSLDTDISDANWTSEIATGTADTSMAFGKRELRPHPLAKPIKVSNKLLRQTGQPGAVDAESLVRERMAYKFGTVQEAGFMTGTGSQQPLGLFTANANGISTGRDVSTGNTTTSIQTDNLQEVKWTLKPQYRNRPGTRWVFHSDALKQIAKLKDGDGQYIWQAGITAGAPDRLLNLPYVESRYAPNTFTTGLYVGLLGDLSYYWIVESLSMQIQRVVELYAATNETGFFGRVEVDGAPVLEEAFVRVKLA